MKDPAGRPGLMMGVIGEKLAEVRRRMRAAAGRAGRPVEQTELIAVTKTVPAVMIQEALACGQLVFGENRVQEALGKMKALEGTPARWHFLGHLQTNKARQAIGSFDLIHSVDSARIARAIGDRALRQGPPAFVQPVLVEVNISGEKTKMGVAPERLMDLLKEISPMHGLNVRGLMTIPPMAESPEASRPYYRALRQTAERVLREGIENVSMEILSMGMSGDFEVAIEEGATLIRVGSAIFGERDYN